jgi:hypothetical protein
VEVEVKSVVLLLNEAVSGADVFECPGPSTAGVADATVFGVEGRDARGAQGLTQMPGVREIVFRSPIASVDVEENGMKRFGARQAYVEKLI